MTLGVTVKGLPERVEDRVVRRRSRRPPAKDVGVRWINVYPDPGGGYVYGMEWGRWESAERAVLNGQRALYRLRVRVKP